jgi:hypothetical protein
MSYSIYTVRYQNKKLLSRKIIKNNQWIVLLRGMIFNGLLKNGGWQALSMGGLGIISDDGLFEGRRESIPSTHQAFHHLQIIPTSPEYRDTPGFSISICCNS